MTANNSTEYALSPLANVGQISVADFQAASYTSTASRLTNAARNDGATDTVLHLGNQIKTQDVIGRVLTISHVGYAYAPAKDSKGNPIFEDEPDEDGVAIQKMSRFPVCHFSEAPGWWYNGGSMLDGIIKSWAKEMGDKPDSDNLPAVNAELNACGGVQAYFRWKDKQDNSGQKYVDIILG